MTASTGRSAAGEYVRTVEAAERRAEAARLHATGWTYARIAEHYGVGRRHAISMVQDALAEAGKADREQALAIELAKLDGYEHALLEVLTRNHVTVSNGRVIRIDEVPLLDDGPVVAAVAGLLRVSERRSKLRGLDAPARQTVTVITEDAVDAELRRLEAELAGNETPADA